ncbi:MAG: DNA polymerase V family protein [Actinomycetota bacterium]|uniref:DNA polymerase V family protein n=1 Tax=Mycobacterium lentiflavum TaxID=141349 RepID=A0ABY3UQA8_MYCLN|nr:DNA polymerase V family protein [Mycobacterium lentiflavum]MEE3064660.1 DNA polymerase V family protein [Actinomycetota bacterium]ULP41770.1 DNA polymerase V family protein [Mycobacterium lentiflavum]
MAEAKKPPQDAASKADTMALIAEAEAEAAEAEALAAAARARARAARLRRELQNAQAQGADTNEEADTADEADTAEAKIDDTVTDSAESDTDSEESDTDTTGDDEGQTDEDAADSDKTVTDTDVTDTGAAKIEEEASDETSEDTEPGLESADSQRRLRWPSLSVTWKAAVILLICVFVGASGFMVWQHHETTQRNQRIANFVAGARQGVVNMTSLDFNRAKEDVQRVIDSSTGQFRDDFQQRSKDFTTVVEQSKVVTQGTVNAAAVQSIDGNSALVLVAATSRITNAAGAKDEPRRWRLRVTVTEDGGQYKMSKLEFIP